MFCTLTYAIRLAAACTLYPGVLRCYCIRNLVPTASQHSSCTEFCAKRVVSLGFSRAMHACVTCRIPLSSSPEGLQT